MSVGRYALGVVALVCVLGSVAAGASAVRARLVPQWRGSTARLADAVLSLALLILTAQLLGSVGLFRLVPIVIAALAIGGGLRLWLVPLPGGTRERAKARGHPVRAALVLGLPMLVAAVVAAEWSGPILQAYGRGILGADSVSYHLPWAASFAQTGQITGIRYTDVQYLTGFYPATSELLHGLGIVLMGNDVLSPGLNLMWLALVLLAAWCVGQPRGVGPATLLAAAVVMGAPFMFFFTAGTADNDAAAAFFMLAAVALWVNATGGPGDEPTPTEAKAAVPVGGLVVSAVAAGLAISVKLSLLAPVALMSAAVIAWAPASRRRIVAGTWAAGVVVAGGFWYLRNLIAVGNPVPFFSFGFLPTPQPPPLQQHTNYSVLSYLHAPHLFTTSFAREVAAGLGPWWAVILGVAVLGAVLTAACGPDRLVRLLALVALLSLAAYLVSPGSASGPWGNPRGFSFNLRYGAPALTVALAVGALAAPLTRPRLRWLPIVGLSAIFVATIAQERLWSPTSSVPRSPGFTVPGDLAGAALVISLGAALLWIPWSKLRGAAHIRRLGALTALATLLLAGAAAGYAGQEHYLRSRYANGPALEPLVRLWRWARTVHDQRIALGGTLGWYFGYPVYGTEDSNRIAYLGQHGAHGSFTLIGSCRVWRRAVNAGRYGYVVTTAFRRMWTGALRFSPEGSWTRGDPAVELVEAFGGRSAIAIYRVRGRLDPAACPAGAGARTGTTRRGRTTSRTVS